MFFINFLLFPNDIEQKNQIDNAIGRFYKSIRNYLSLFLSIAKFESGGYEMTINLGSSHLEIE